MVVAKKFIYAKAFDGMPTNENLRIVTEELPPLKDREYLVEAVYLSVDPYMRAYCQRLNIGDTMIGSQIAKVIDSKSKKFPVGSYVVGSFGWRTHTIASDDEAIHANWGNPSFIPFKESDAPLSLALGTLGMPGNTAYFGLLEICNPKSGETVVISGAAGAVGSIVGQIAKIKGCTVIGIVGSDEKGKWIKSIGFDSAINYKTQDLRKALAEVAPQGIDCYFDNVGGETSSIVLEKMNSFGRIAVCGSISVYNNIGCGELPKATSIQTAMILNQLDMKGFLVGRWMDRWDEAISQNLQWLKEGKLKYKETITEGFENMTNALVGILKGENTGKALVKV